MMLTHEVERVLAVVGRVHADDLRLLRGTKRAAGLRRSAEAATACTHNVIDNDEDDHAHDEGVAVASAGRRKRSTHPMMAQTEASW